MYMYVLKLVLCATTTEARKGRVGLWRGCGECMAGETWKKKEEETE